MRTKHGSCISLVQQTFLDCPLPASQASHREGEDNPQAFPPAAHPLLGAGRRPGVRAWASESQRGELLCESMPLLGSSYRFPQILEKVQDLRRLSKIFAQDLVKKYVS